ncbi:peptidoglycan/LPS O-acetylase OafA/YrhL [Granulicella aggregans]|uniref:Peptidoglycan/LPS O-acetylase OafA/YrhL n=1 Tax=Granulicella aggregans TaxID=474949 RepID=A0A7W8E5C8_9BACT|nr:acyltransferase [Granulicella aggregans]MBB5059149.1 peptidoglycan/LPS O-acetylase OafA/YrhL [Granulicella aggregans]
MQTLWGLLRRDTGGRVYVPEIDSFRFVAIVFVILYHLLQKTHLYLLEDPSFMTSRLNRGVQLFFTVSGFVLALPFAKFWLQRGRKVELKTYFLRRLTRIEPPYLVSVLLCLAVLIVVKKQPLGTLIPHFLATLFYMHSVIYAALSTINPVAWSLEVEIQFYLLVPLLVYVFAIRNTRVRRTVLVMATLAFSAFGLSLNGHYRSDHSIVGTLQFFVAGFLLADLYLLNPPKVRTYLWDVAAVLGWYLVLATDKQWWNLMMPLGLVAVYWSAFAGKLVNVVFRSRFTSTIGGMCYSIYLIHQQIIGVVAIKLHSAAMVWAVSLGLISVCCTVFYLLVEKPCMDHRWPEKLRQYVVKEREAVAVGD